MAIGRSSSEQLAVGGDDVRMYGCRGGLEHGTVDEVERFAFIYTLPVSG